MDKTELNELYKTDPRFRQYVDKYAAYKNRTPEDAIRHSIVQEYALYLKEEHR